MRSVPPGELLRALTVLLEAQVVPAVADQPARATLMLTVGMLDNLAGRIEERRDLVALDTGTVERLVAALPPSLHWENRHVGGDYRELSAILTAVLRELAVDGAPLDDPAVVAWLDLCRVELRQRNAEEIARARPTRYLRSQSE